MDFKIMNSIKICIFKYYQKKTITSFKKRFDCTQGLQPVVYNYLLCINTKNWINGK